MAEVESVLFAKPKLGTGFTSKERLKLLVLLMMMKGNRPELKLKRYDYFGYGFASIEHQADVIALSKWLLTCSYFWQLICLVLAHENCTLLQPKSIWNADKAQKTCSLVENILHLDPIEVFFYQNFFSCSFISALNMPDILFFFAPPPPPPPLEGKHISRDYFAGYATIRTAYKVQALAAATKTVDCLKLLHSVHAHFLLAGDSNTPIIYQVHRMRDGKSSATQRVDAIQKGINIFTLLASFKKEEGSVHQQATMPSVPVPDTLLSMEELHEKRLLDPHLPRTYQIKAAAMKFVPWLIDQPLRLNPHQAYASDLMFSNVSLNPHRGAGVKLSSVSLDHAFVTFFYRRAGVIELRMIKKCIEHTVFSNILPGCGFTGRLELMAGYCMWYVPICLALMCSQFR
ncbi:hypothetical protein DVH24_014632 [Malus domestica]|uniref:Acyl-CoA thioesterase-like N-terminal HotDog domain-containing protein n=1 Tax=Malus domestica TaxID=3750 RepID=A0A498KKT2_MALDO|nr:hypothetical protein DVH24_014632 [Malus domestica]